MSAISKARRTSQPRLRSWFATATADGDFERAGVERLDRALHPRRTGGGAYTLRAGCAGGGGGLRRRQGTCFTGLVCTVTDRAPDFMHLGHYAPRRLSPANLYRPWRFQPR